MIVRGKSFHMYRFDAAKLPFKFAIAVLFLALAPLVGGQTLQPLCSFNFTNGAGPEAALTLGNDGNFYGTTEGGGASGGEGDGTIFQVTTNGTLTTLVLFNVTNGTEPMTALTLGNDGNFYGTTPQGGVSGGWGTVFKVTTNGTLTTLVSFSSIYPNPDDPEAALTLGNDGNFYGTTEETGNEAYGTVFQVTTNRTLTSLASFYAFGGNVYPSALTLGNDGNFYGTTEGGGSVGASYGDGTVFKVTTNGTLTMLVSFSGTNGYSPNGLTLGNDGNFYGTTYGGGSYAGGTIFQVTTNGTLTTLASFNGTNGAGPVASLTLGDDGNFYGTTKYGGSTYSPFTDGFGTIFQLTTNGTLTTLYSFTNGMDGAYLEAALTLGNDRNFYGTTQNGGVYYYGSVFRLLMTPAFSVQPESLTNNAGATVTFTCETILKPVGLQWQKNGTNLANGGNISGATNSTLTITGILDGDAASYSVMASNAKGSVSSFSATLTVIDPPNITAQPTNMVVLAGTNVAFALTLTGTPPFTYQWLFNITNLLYGWNAIYTIPRAETNNAGNYSVVVSNPAGSVTSSIAALTVVFSPTSQTKYASSTATFTVTAIGPESLNYQWQKNGTNLVNGGNISGATNSTLTIASISDADAANYTALVSDAYSGVTTSNAMLTVIDSLFFAAQPLSQMVRAGSMVTFTATAYGAPPFVFRWSFNQTPIGSPTTGTNFSSFTLTNVGTNQAGDYSVEVFNGTGNLTSSNAVLTVIQPPTLALQILAGYPLVSLYGTLGNNFVVQYNANLADTNWQTLLFLTNLATSPYQFLDPSGLGHPARFYRALLTQ